MRLLLHSRYSSRDSIRIYMIPTELPHSSKLEPRKPVGPRRILIELPTSSYEESSRQVGWPSDPQSVVTLPTRLRLAITLRMGALQVKSPKCGVCSHFHHRGVFIGSWWSSTNLEKSVWRQVVAGRPSHVAGRLGGAASTDFLHRPCLLFLV
jgi:hypothetical protein